MMFYKSKEIFMAFNQNPPYRSGICTGAVLVIALTIPVLSVEKSWAVDDQQIILPQPSMVDDTDETLKRITEDMERDRQQQRRIKELKMQKEETDLELEEQKALCELMKFKKDNMATVSDRDAGANMDIKIVYLGGTDAQKEAILSINGTNYFVKDKESPLKNMRVQSITDDSVTIHFLSPDSISTYQFKSE